MSLPAVAPSPPFGDAMASAVVATSDAPRGENINPFSKTWHLTYDSCEPIGSIMQPWLQLSEQPDDLAARQASNLVLSHDLLLRQEGRAKARPRQ